MRVDNPNLKTTVWATAFPTSPTFNIYPYNWVGTDIVSSTDVTSTSVGFNPRAFWEDSKFSFTKGFAYYETLEKNLFRWVHKSENGGSGLSVGDTINIRATNSVTKKITENLGFVLEGNVVIPAPPTPPPVVAGSAALSVATMTLCALTFAALI